uniref:E3 ubiquitin-protein ligase TRIM36-like isoform X2 n=1 Tax=Myxine glutinosa TaxID=7769 RepID=UPI00358E522B
MSDLSELSEQSASQLDLRNDDEASMSVERELLCPACDEFFIQPLVLPCQHNVCHKCAKELLSGCATEQASNCIPQLSSQLRSTITSPVQSHGSTRTSKIHNGSPSPEKGSNSRQRRSLRVSTSLPCPACGVAVQLGDKGLAGLFRNFTLETIAERYRRAARAAAALTCQACTVATRPQKKAPPTITTANFPGPSSTAVLLAAEATKSCLDCRKSFCNLCYKVHHPWGTNKAAHECVAATSALRPKVLMCAEHENERVCVFCDTCCRPVCNLCRNGGAHSHHHLAPLNAAYRSLKEKISRDVELLTQRELSVKSDIEQLEDLIQQTEFICERAESTALVSFGNAWQALASHEAEVRTQLEESKHKRINWLGNRVQEARGLLKHGGLLGLAREVLLETEPACFAQAARPLQTRLEEAVGVLATWKPGELVGKAAALPELGNEIQKLTAPDVLQGTARPSFEPLQCRAYDLAELHWLPPLGQGNPHDYCLEFRVAAGDCNHQWESVQFITADHNGGLSPSQMKGRVCSPDDCRHKPSERCSDNDKVEQRRSNHPLVLDCETDGLSFRVCTTDVDGNQKLNPKLKLHVLDKRQDVKVKQQKKDGFQRLKASPVGDGKVTDKPVLGGRLAVEGLQEGEKYAFRVYTTDSEGHQNYSCEMTLHTPPAPIFAFLLNAACNDRLLLSSNRAAADRRAAPALLLGDAEHDVHPAMDFVVADRPAPSTGRHYWAFRVRPCAYMVRAGVATEARVRDWLRPTESKTPSCVRCVDSGHGSGSEEAEAETFVYISAGGGRLAVPSASTASSLLPLPARLGVCLDCDNASVAFYDGDSMSLLASQPLDCQGPIYPAFGLLGSGRVELELPVLGPTSASPQLGGGGDCKH